MSPERTRKDFLDPPEAYSQPKCYVKTGNQVKNIQCHELAEILLSQERPDIQVCSESTGKCVEARSSDKLVIAEVSGSEVYANVRESDYVKRGSKLAYVITNKKEVRSLRSDFEGLVVLVHEVPASRPPKLIIFIREGGASD